MKPRGAFATGPTSTTQGSAPQPEADLATLLAQIQSVPSPSSLMAPRTAPRQSQASPSLGQDSRYPAQDSASMPPKIAAPSMGQASPMAKLAKIAGHDSNPLKSFPSMGGMIDQASTSMGGKLATSMGKTEASMAKIAAQDSQPAKPKGEFVPGVRPTPTGPTARELWSEPESRLKLQAVIAEWEKANPGRNLKATHLAAAWNAKHPDKPLNEARARTLKGRIEAAREQFLMDQVTGYIGRGAKKVLG